MIFQPDKDFDNFLKLQDGADDSSSNAGVTNLGGGWTNHDVDPQLVKAYRDIINNDAAFQASNQYSSTNGFHSAITQVANFERVIFNARGLNNSQVLLGHSASNLVLNVLSTLISPGDTILLNKPCYPNFIYQAQALGANIEFYDTVDQNLENTISEEGLLEKIRSSKCKAYLICLPDNPLGLIFSQALYNQVAEELKKQGAYLIIDYSYRIFTYEQVPDYYGNPDHDNVVAIHSFSKSFVSMGRRLGYVIANENMIMKIKANQMISLLCPDSLHQMVMREYLKNSLGDSSLDHYLTGIKKQYQTVFEACKTILSDEKIVFAGSKNGIYFYIKSNKPYEAVLSRLEEKKIKVVSGKLFANSDSYIRLSIGPLIRDAEKLYSSLDFIIGSVK